MNKDTTLIELVEEMGIIILAKKSTNITMTFHSPKNLGGTHSHKSNRVFHHIY